MKQKTTKYRHSLKIGLVGAGAVGVPLALLLRHKGFNIHAVVSRTSRAAAALAAKVQCAAAGSDFTLLTDCHLIFITVPDSQISAVAAKLQKVHFQNRKVIVIHTSGTHTSLSLAKLKESDSTRVYMASMHPMQTFPRKMNWTKNTLENHFENIYFGIEGDSAAYPVMTEIILTLGGRCLKITAAQKTLYHMGGVFCSNFLIVLLYISEKIYAKMGLKKNEPIDVLLPIIIQTLNNAKVKGVAASLTGPAERNDVRVIENHLRTLKKFYPKYAKAYRELTGICYEIVRANKRPR
ncbi:DUF2520 domain-containing protein [bacterium]|nr:DUF2520 domain-containing protein [bacterium]